jgi:hypothetical protein
MRRTITSAVVLMMVSACGAASAGTTPPTASASASASVPGPADQAPPAAACSPGAPVPGCTVVGDPFGVPPTCHATTGVVLDAHSNANKLPSYGYGTGPVYLTGQNSWFAAGQEAEFLIDPTYTGAVHITGQRTEGGATMPLFSGPSSSGPTIDVPAGNDQPYWRFWDGQMSFTQPGCYTLTLQTASANEAVIIYVHGGTPLPG